MTASATEWSTAAHPRRDSYEEWESKLQQVYGAFRFDGKPSDAFAASIRHRVVSGFQVVDCRCDPCGATRTGSEMSLDTREVLGIQLVLQGREHISFENEQIVLTPGDLLIWDTTRPMRFQVMESLHKVSVLLPLARLQSWLPRSWHSIRHKLDKDSNAAKLMASYVCSVSPMFMSGAFSQSDGLTESAIGLLVTALEEPQLAISTSLREVQMEQVRGYIEAHLEDPELSPATIANGTRISVRYLHWLFKSTGTTAFQYVVHKRLLRCRLDLENPRMQGRKIIDIAYSAGFQNATHFARRFRDEFGMSPKDYRDSRLEIAANLG
ncbi:helix-turn-helix domain-containing protein [Nevskia sp.]|uniref:helix-turn-helix domain-containing protein n=1 Tax=Nevskia sp. TaxID=1929292 RepID=UPI0025E36A95|nr:helix-turn-helix domain-containing protein [Nevskia sp.]